MNVLVESATFFPLPGVSGQRMYRISHSGGSYLSCGPCYDHSKPALHNCRITEVISDEPCSTVASVSAWDDFFKTMAIDHHQPGHDGVIPTNPSGPCRCDQFR